MLRHHTKHRSATDDDSQAHQQDEGVPSSTHLQARESLYQVHYVTNRQWRGRLRDGCLMRLTGTTKLLSIKDNPK